VSYFNTDTSVLDSLVQPGRHKMKVFPTKKMNSVRYLYLFCSVRSGRWSSI